MNIYEREKLMKAIRDELMFYTCRKDEFCLVPTEFLKGIEVALTEFVDFLGRLKSEHN